MESSRSGVRRNATVACDSCRSRRVRCVTSMSVNDGPTRCDACHQAKRECNFAKVQKPRGPQPRQPEGHMYLTWSLSPKSPAGRKITASDESEESAGYVEYGDIGDERSFNDPMTSVATVSPQSATDSPLADYAQAYSPYDGTLSCVHVSPPPDAYSTDVLCCRTTLDLILQDWLDFLYPLYPVVHIPTFRAQLTTGRERIDVVFLSLLIACCSTVVAIIPDSFHRYRACDDNFRFKSRVEMVDFCHELIISFRMTDYFDVSTQPKWAISILLATALRQFGLVNRTLMFAAEGYHHLRRMECLDVSTYQNLPYIEAQLRKKAVCMSSHAFFHEAIADLKTADSRLGDWFGHFDFDNLMPLEVDDEFIYEDKVLPQPLDRLPLTSGLIALSRLYYLATPCYGVVSTSFKENSSSIPLATSSLDGRVVADKQAILRMRFERLKYSLDGVPEMFRPWAPLTAEEPKTSYAVDHKFHRQCEIMRANIQVTHLWLQSNILEEIAAGTTSESPVNRSYTHPNSEVQILWSAREDICRQLLNILHNISRDNLGPNGFMLVQKIRAVAATLLDCPFESQGPVARRANDYIQTFANILSKLDWTTDSGTQGQEWLDLARYARQSYSEIFSATPSN